MKNNTRIPYLHLVGFYKNVIHGMLLVVGLLLPTIAAKGQVVSTYSINSSTVEKINKWIDKDTIVFVELDEVLVMPKSKMFYYNDNPYRSFIYNLINLSNKNSRYLAPVVKWYQSRQIRLVEDGWQNFIDNLKKRKIPVYGFCTMPIYLTQIEQYRYGEIEKLGIRFTDKINDKDLVEINNQDGWKSVFYHGIIFTGPFSKSQTMLDFIKITNISPKKIVVFDKIQNESQIMDRTLRRFRMEYYNIIYLGARAFEDKPNPSVVALQQAMLLEQGKWLEDEEAEKMLTTEKVKPSISVP